MYELAGQKSTLEPLDFTPKTLEEPYDALGADGGDVTSAIVVAADGYTDIRDMGYLYDLDEIDWAPNSGWSPTGAEYAVAGHGYVVWTRDDHYAKFRITSIDIDGIYFDWAYQIDPGNPEL